MRNRVNYAADIPHDLRTSDETLHRYGRWAMDRMRVHRCGSAEGRYRPPPDETVEDDARREPREVLMSTSDAMAAHRALQRVPAPERDVLQMLYIPQRLPIEAQIRIKRIPRVMCQERHLRGLRMFANLIKTHA